VEKMLDRIERKLEYKIIPFAAIAVLALIIYCNSFSAPFILDDFGSISNNYAIRNLFNLAEIWKFYSNRFILYFTLSINYALHDTAVEGYRAVNVAIHIFNGFLLFLILKHLFSLDYFKRTYPGKFKNLISLACSLIFVSHPVQVNAVTYIVQRTASLAAMFYLLAILFFIKFRIKDKFWYFLLTLFFTIIAMFTKENTITIPFMLALIEFLFFLNDGKTSWAKRLLFLFILFLTVPIIPGTNLLLKGYSQSDPSVAFKASTSMDRMHYFYTELNVIIKYIKQLFIPNNLNFDYSNDFPVSKTIWDNYSYISFLILCMIGFYALINVRRNKLISFGILWFFIGLAVESSFISIKDVYFEHRLYFPLAGFIIFITGFIFRKHTRDMKTYIIKKPFLMYITAVLFMVILYSGITLQRNYIFSDGIRLWSDVAKKAPGSDRAHSVLATNYLDNYEMNDSKNVLMLDFAEMEFKKAIDIYYYNSTAHCNLAKVYLLKGEYEKCIDESNKTNRIEKSEYAYHNLGMAYKNLGKTDESIKAFLEGYKLDNKSTFILKALGNTYYEIKDYKNAAFYYEEFLKNNIYSDNKEIRIKLDEIKNTKHGTS
jgi:tetratricopeptide (TPR) repeat protein